MEHFVSIDPAAVFQGSITADQVKLHSLEYVMLLRRYSPGSPAAARALQAMKQGWQALKTLPRVDRAAIMVTGGVLVPFSAPEATSRQARDQSPTHHALETFPASAGRQIRDPYFW